VEPGLLLASRDEWQVSRKVVAEGTIQEKSLTHAEEYNGESDPDDSDDVLKSALRCVSSYAPVLGSSWKRNISII
jgi:hypothetical protein